MTIWPKPKSGQNQVNPSILNLVDQVSQTCLQRTTALPAPLKHDDIYGRPDEPAWLQAELDDFQAKMAQGAFEILDRSQVPAGQRLTKMGYAYANKIDPVTRDLVERRARLIGKGYSQIAGSDFTETSCGTMRGSTVRSIFCCAAIDDCEICCGDVAKALGVMSQDMQNEVGFCFGTGPNFAPPASL